MYRGSLGVFADVVQAFLRYPVDNIFYPCRKMVARQHNRAIYRNTGLGLPFLAEILEGFRQSLLHHVTGSQLDQQGAQFQQGFLGQSANRSGLFDSLALVALN